MRIFQEVVRRGSITEASRALGYTQSAVSRHVAALEAEYGVRLLERGPSGVEPTPYWLMTRSCGASSTDFSGASSVT